MKRYAPLEFENFNISKEMKFRLYYVESFKIEYHLMVFLWNRLVWHLGIQLGDPSWKGAIYLLVEQIEEELK